MAKSKRSFPYNGQFSGYCSLQVSLIWTCRQSTATRVQPNIQQNACSRMLNRVHVTTCACGSMQATFKWNLSQNKAKKKNQIRALNWNWALHQPEMKNLSLCKLPISCLVCVQRQPGPQLAAGGWRPDAQTSTLQYRMGGAKNQEDRFNAESFSSPQILHVCRNSLSWILNTLLDI